MMTLRRLTLTGVSALALAASFQFTTGCRPKSETTDAVTAPQANEPEKFTAKLTEIEGVQMLYTLRHPKLINQELDTLMTEIPEAALARMFLGNLAAFGYPEFSELAAGTNIGIAMLEVSEAELASGNPTLVGFAKLKEGGKIWKVLSQRGLALQKQGDWVLISPHADAFAKIKAPAAIIAQIEQPQDEEIRLWGRTSPALLDRVKKAIIPQLETKLTSLTPEEKKAALAYVDVLWGYLAQLHSGGGSFDLNHQGISIGYNGQFLPDSATGRFLRRDLGASPKIAESVPADGMITVLVRQNIPGQVEFATGLLDALIAVDYAPVASSLKTIKDTYLAFSKNNDGGAALSMNMTFPADGKQPEVDMFGVYSGKFTEAQVFKAYQDTLDLSKTFTQVALQAATSLVPGAEIPQIDQKLNENALTIDGIKFGSVVSTTKINVLGQEQVTTTTQYFGVAAGNLVYSTNEAALRAKLPAIVAQRKVENPIKLTLKGDEMMAFAVHGEHLVEAVLTGVKLDRNDTDIQAQIKSLKDGYAAAEPIKATLNTSQAKASVNVVIPYKFIAQSIRLGQFSSAHKVTAALDSETSEPEVMEAK